MLSPCSSALFACDVAPASRGWPRWSSLLWFSAQALALLAGAVMNSVRLDPVAAWADRP